MANSFSAETPSDPRDARNGLKIPVEGYCDQPYVVINKDGSWLCTMTTGPGTEGAKGEHMVSTVSKDQGRTWSPLVGIEPNDGPESSYGVPVVTPSGRVYVIYDYNGDRVAELNGKKVRADMLGWYVYKYSDDGGQSWSKDRYRIPMRTTACDLANQWQGKVQIFWGIDKPNIVAGSVYFGFTKLGKYMLDNGEGWFYHSDNLLTETDPAKIHWELLPDGDNGLRAQEFGSVQEEHNIVPLSDGKSFYCVYRTTTGYPCHAYSNDGCHTWTKPEPMTYSPGGRKMKTNRACPMLWRAANGKFLFWFNNHSGKSWENRNPVWLSGGVEKNGRIYWSQPEIVLYDPDVKVRMSYPDLIEQDGRYWITETNKTVARAHEIDKALLEGLWNQAENKTETSAGFAMEMIVWPTGAEGGVPALKIDAAKGNGFSIEARMHVEDLKPGQRVYGNSDAMLVTAEQGALRMYVKYGAKTVVWESDPGVLTAGKSHHVVATVDARAQIITFVIDGFLCNGGETRQFGWGRLQDGGTEDIPQGAPLKGQLGTLRVYSRPLRTSEAVGNFNAGQ
ncbi:MAG TPA: exo-alpha-sialidase [Planctomycetota bacterium]|jgi:hypothetical protein